YCLNPQCPHPQNPHQNQFCQTCGAKLLLGDRYRALRPIGQGGFGRTLLAVDEQIPAHPHCVIKQFFLLRQRQPQFQKAAALFRQEAMRLDELGSHPQIPELLAYFEAGDRQYLVQTFVDGQTLSQQLAHQGVFQEGQIRRLLQNLLPVLQFIHDRQVIHRDIKPENIIRAHSDEQLVLVDFGAAKFTEGCVLDQTGTVIGSAGYAAPEQTAGKAVFASDIYSLGVTCLHLMTQVPPFDLYSFGEGQWVWRSFLRQPISDALGHILDKMLEPKISHRYQSAQSVLRSLTPEPIRLGFKPLIASSTAPATASASAPQSSQAWRCVHTLTGHGNSVSDVAISPDGKKIVSCSFDKTIKLWHLRRGILFDELRGYLEPVLSVDFMPDGKTLVSGSVDDTIKLWDLETRSPLLTLRGHRGSVLSLCVAISLDGRVLASGSDDHTVKVWQLEQGELVHTLHHPRAVTSVAISPDGALLASGSNDNIIRLWQLDTGKLLQQLQGHPRDINTVAISPDNQTLISGSSDHTIKIWQLQTGALRHTLYGHSDWVRVVITSPDGQTLASGSSDRTIQLWNLKARKPSHTLTGHAKDVNAIAFSPDGQTLVSGSSDRTLKVWRRT
ncbi:MAG: protein kinase, partial [Cyanothece sp. SIO1E1]|nr:protein kinase [Cyanothece sp. SIO1E1]